jgi:putative transposase
VKYAFIKEHRQEFRLLSMCRVLKVHRSGYYAWLKEPQSPRALENAKLSEQIRYYYDQSMGIYGSPRIYHDLKEAGISCSENRVARLMKASQPVGNQLVLGIVLSIIAIAGLAHTKDGAG